MITKIIPLPDMYMEVKGITALIFHSVMRLEDAYKYGNHNDRKEKIRQYKQYRDFFIGQAENNNFSLVQKITLYSQLLNEVCMRILSHQKPDYYNLYPLIYKMTKHYAVRIIERIEQLEALLSEREELEHAIKLKETGIEKTTKMRHHYALVIDGIDYSLGNMKLQLEVMREKLKRLDKE